MEEHIKEFGLYIAAEKGLSPLTQEAYLRDLHDFTEFLALLPVQAFSHVLEEHIVSFLAYRAKKGCQPATLMRQLISIKLLFRFLKRERMLERDVSRLLEGPKLWQLIPDVLTNQEVEALLSQPKMDTPLGARDLAILELLYASGLRVTELCKLCLYDVDEEKVRVMGKGGKERVVPVGRKALEAIDLYLLKFRGGATLDRKEPLFVSRGGKPLERVQVWRLIKKYAKGANIKKNISPHTLRHSFATHLLDNGADVRVIQEMLGHSSIDSTDRYTHISKAHLKKAFEHFHPKNEA